MVKYIIYLILYVVANIKHCVHEILCANEITPYAFEYRSIEN